MKLLLLIPLVAGFSLSMANALNDRPVSHELMFMRSMISKINPGLTVEDQTCATELPRAILSISKKRELDWVKMFTLAWQESDFDCHAKNKQDIGGAYGPFQIRRIWEPVIGDPREFYFDPELAAKRVVRVIEYYRDTERFKELVDRQFRNPLLCLYNTGETLKRVNMRYCRQAGTKLRVVQEAWREYNGDGPQTTMKKSEKPVVLRGQS